MTPAQLFRTPASWQTTKTFRRAGASAELQVGPPAVFAARTNAMGVVPVQLQEYSAVKGGPRPFRRAGRAKETAPESTLAIAVGPSPVREEMGPLP